MSYPDIQDQGLFENLLRRKEFYSLKADPKYNFRDPPEGRNDPLIGKYLKIHSHQLFVRNFINPHTKYQRLHLSHVMGSGKTLGAVSIAQGFIDIYHQMYIANTAKLPLGRKNYVELDRSTPSVFVLGFGGTKGAFVRELLRYPDFGFVSLTEKDELEKRKKASDGGMLDDIKSYKEYYTMLKKRITNKSKGGFYKFFGYDEFVNRLFISEDVKLVDLEAEAVQRLRAGEPTALEDVFAGYIKSGAIQVNYQLLSMFENSLLICDEVHNTYNMNMKNNRGVAIQFILDSVPSVRLLTISATPINNSPTEAVELINYLVPPDKKITKRGFFSNSRTLLPGKLEEIGELTRGRISFLQDINVKYFPQKIFLGKPLVLPKTVDVFAAGTEVPYLKFIECPMSEFHQATYAAFAKEVSAARIGGPGGDEEEAQEGASVILDSPPALAYHAVPTDGHSIYDMVFPGPDSESIGIFRSGEVRNKISLATQEWKDANKISMKKYSVMNNIITGDFLALNTVGKYSTKYETLVKILFEIIGQSEGNPAACQKIMIYHDRVKMSGVLLIQELLRANGLLDEFAEPSDSTICCICGQPFGGHAGTHGFIPVRFIMAHSDMDKTLMDQSLARFNNPDNRNGLNYMILVGSRIIRESYDFKDIQNLIIVSLPINIPTLLQVLGRCIRKNSHINLPPGLRRVFIRILISTVRAGSVDIDPISPEMYRYIDKLADYMVIQKIEREFNRHAIDASIHRDIIMPRDLRAEYFPEGTAGPVSMLGNLYFEPVYELPNYDLDAVVNTTFNAYKYYEEEIKTISYILKRLFMATPVWTYDELWAAVRRPPVGVEMNPALFSESNFIIALNNLVTPSIPVVSATVGRGEITESMLVERLFDQGERYIYIGGERNKIEQIDKYYILFPIETMVDNPLNTVYTEYLEHSRDKERALIKELAESADRVVIDVETYLRRPRTQVGTRINVAKFVKDSRVGINYAAKKAQFIAKYGPLEDITEFILEYPEPFQISFLEEAIQYAVVAGSSGAEDNQSPEHAVLPLYKKVLALFDKFRVIIYLKEVAKYKDTAKQYKYGLPSLPDSTPLGFSAAKTVRLFDPQIESSQVHDEGQRRGFMGHHGGRWLEVSKIALNRHVTYKENDIIVGHLESAGDSMRFKLRKPVHRIKDDILKESHARKMTKSELEGIAARTVANDTRLIERGIVCNTKNKRDLLHIIAALGISASQLAKQDIRIKRLCEVIKDRLIALEIKERQHDSRYKYLYSWWDETVNIAAAI